MAKNKFIPSDSVNPKRNTPDSTSSAGVLEPGHVTVTTSSGEDSDQMSRRRKKRAELSSTRLDPRHSSVTGSSDPKAVPKAVVDAALSKEYHLAP